MPPIPLIDLKAQYSSLRPEIQAAMNEVLDAQRFILGPKVEELEKLIAAMSGVPHAIGCASGSDALILAIAAAGGREGTRVVTSPFTFFASAGAIVHAGGRPAFCDIRPDTFNLDPEKLPAALGPDVKAVVAVHLFGQMAEMDPILAVCAPRGIAVIEDAAQAIGATDRGADGKAPERIAGSMGLAGCLSFFPTKNLGGAGDGGMITTTTETLATRLRRLRVHGGLKMYHHDEVGWNSRLDELQAAVLLVKAKRLDAWSTARTARADIYDRLFAEARLPGPVSEGLVTPPVRRPGARHIFHQYTIRAAKRDALREHLSARGIGSGVYYPVPLHLQKCFADLGYRAGDFPVSEKAAQEVLSLPIFPELTEAAQAEVVREIAAFYGLGR